MIKSQCLSNWVFFLKSAIYDIQRMHLKCKVMEKEKNGERHMQILTKKVDITVLMSEKEDFIARKP